MITTYEALSMGQYQEIDRITRTGGDELEVQVAILSILTGKPEAELLRLPLAEYTDLAGQSNFLRKPLEKVPKTRKEYALGEWRLRPCQDYRKLTAGQYIDFQAFLPDLDTYLVEFLSTMLVPKGKRYCEGYDVADVQKAIRDHMTMGDAIPLTAFFFKSLETSIADMLNYSESMAKGIRDKEQRQEMLTKIHKVKEALRRNGDG